MIDALHILPSSHSRGGGLSGAVEGLSRAQRAAGLSVELLPADAARPGRRTATLLEAARRCQPAILHSHGLWLAPSRASRCWRRNGAGATVVAPHGMLDPWTWQRHRRLKQLVWHLGEAETLGQASCLQALCPAEAAMMRQRGLRNPIALIPNGIAEPDRQAALPPPPWAAGLPAGAPVLLFLGRFHRKKGIEELLVAWQRLQEQGGSSGCGDWWLVFAGFGDDGALKRRLAEQQLRQCRVLGPVFGRDRDSAYAHAGAFVLPSFSEGLPLAALEAMSWGLPCLLSRNCNLPEAFARGAAWPAEPEPVLLASQLQRFCQASSDEHTAMARAGEALVAGSYSWPHVAEQCRQLYAWILGGGDAPACVLAPG